MKILALAILALALLLGAYYYLQPDQANALLKKAGIASTPETTRVYKWRDDQGNWHVSGTPPPDGIKAEIKDYRSDENVLPVPPQLQGKD